MDKLIHNLRMRKRRILKRMQYLVMRHSIPMGEGERQALRIGPKIFANSIPKAGTNLLARLLWQLPCVARRWCYHVDETIPGYLEQLKSVGHGQIITAHLGWDELLVHMLSREGFRVFFMVRDLRDVMVSHMYYVTYKDPSHPLHPYLKNLASNEERLMACITGVQTTRHLGGTQPKEWNSRMQRLLRWLDEPTCLTVRFENLIGSAGGGSDERQMATIDAIVRHVNTEISQDEKRVIASRIFSRNARTFRKGQIGDWKNHFTEGHKLAFKELRGAELIRLGYENDLDW